MQLRQTADFVDSLGWVHYQLGNYRLAVEFLEKAATLEPEDAVIIAHLMLVGKHSDILKRDISGAMPHK